MKLITNHNSNSIRRHLLLWLMIPLFCLFIFGVFSNSLRGRRSVGHAYDHGLKQIARAVAGQIEFEDGHWTIASPKLSQGLLQPDGRTRTYFRITDSKGRLLGGTKEIGLPWKSCTKPKFRDSIIHGQKVRIVAIQVPLSHGRRKSFMLVQVAETSLERDDIINSILINNIIQQLSLMLLAAISVWIGVRVGLRPLEKVSQAIAAQSPSNLEPLYEDFMPLEIQPLILTFNQLILKLNGYLSSQQRFVANASHQLKTPLSGLQLQMDLLERIPLPDSTQPIIKHMQASLARSSHLVQQLMTLSRAESEQLAVIKLKRVDLVPLTRELVESFVAFALTKNIDIGLEVPEVSVFILGHSHGIRDMVSNLLDNAIRYTPDNGTVTLGLVMGDFIKLRVQDTGPGIPDEEAVKVFERFYRLQDHQTAGSGLGLAIVKEIAVTHHAEVNILKGDNGLGTCVEVIFPVLGAAVSLSSAS